MKSSLLFSLLVLNLGLIGCGGYQSNQNAYSEQDMNGIIGGSPVKLADAELKSTVLLYDTKAGGICTASILSNSILVTAAHCVDGGVANLVIVFALSLDEEKLVYTRAIKAIQHSYWATRKNKSVDQGDIALVKFNPNKLPLPAGYGAATLLQDPKLLVKGGLVTLAGYGTSNGFAGSGSGVLRKVTTTIAMPNFGLTEVLIEQSKGKGACHGDSGGPAYVSVKGQLQLFGVTSRGVSDVLDTCSAFAAYTNILPYKNWIAQASAQL